MKTKMICLISVFWVFLFLNYSFADTLVSTYGDADGFGISATENNAFDWKLLSEKRTEGVTDFFTTRIDLPLQWTHNFILPNHIKITGLGLEIFSGGQGAYGLSQVFFNDQFVGTLTNGEGSGNNYAKKDLFDLSHLLNSIILTGIETIRVETQSSSEEFADNWALDYSKLKIDYIQDTVSAPEPSSSMLFGFGILVFLYVGRCHKAQLVTN